MSLRRGTLLSATTPLRSGMVGTGELAAVGTCVIEWVRDEHRYLPHEATVGVMLPDRHHVLVPLHVLIVSDVLNSPH